MTSTTLTQVATFAKTFAPLYTDANQDEWNTLCNLVANEVATSLQTNIDNVRVFVLNCDNGDNSATTWPVVAQNDNPNIKSSENPITRAELLNASAQTLDDYAAGNIQAWVAYRESTSTGTLNYYGTSQILDAIDSTDYILKIAVSQ